MVNKQTILINGLFTLFSWLHYQSRLHQRISHLTEERNLVSIFSLKSLNLVSLISFWRGKRSPFFLFKSRWPVSDSVKMGGCVSISSQSTCSSKSNGERISPSCLWIDMFRHKRSRRTFSDHVTTLQHLSSIPNRIFTNGRSTSSCIFTQQGRKGINQDAMIVWEVSTPHLCYDLFFLSIIEDYNIF